MKPYGSIGTVSGDPFPLGVLYPARAPGTSGGMLREPCLGVYPAPR
jgi:hypothetical protein